MKIRGRKGMAYIKKFIKSNPKLFASLKHGVLYVRYVKALLEKDKYSNLDIYPYLQLIDIKQRGYHCYFGYYDKSPVNLSGTLVAFLRVKDGSKQTDVADVCVYDLQTKATKVVGHTTTWNWQQGCMLQWVNKDVVSVNAFDEQKEGYCSRWIDTTGGEVVRTFSKAVYNYNHDFSAFLSLNFYRLDLYAKGYGYPYNVDSLDVTQDGIWEVEVRGNSAKLILSLQDVMQHEPKDYLNCQHYINHATYCPDEQYIIFIHRWQVRGGEFVSRLLKYDKVRGQITTLLDCGHVSHFCWRTETELLIYATNHQGEKDYMVVNVDTGHTTMADGLPKEDGHPSYSNDRRYILTDTYPNYGRKQFLFLFNTEKKKLLKLDTLHSPVRYFNENRCDLHPRWSFDNKYVCVDNTATGVRSLKLYQIS